MQQENRMEQLCLDLSSGKMCPEPLAQETQKAMISASYSKNLSELRTGDYLFLDLRAGAGNLLGPCWERNSPLLGEFWTLNTGPAPHNAAGGSTLSQILEDKPHPRYYLSRAACLGILRRSRERGKTLPQVLEAALKIQATVDAREYVAQNEPSPDDVFAFHINQREEAINLGGMSGALMASPNMQMQTFVLNPWDTQQSRISTPGGVSPTLAGADGGGGRNPGGLVICLNDQGGERMDVSENITGTLRAQMDSHPPLVLASQQGGAEIGVGICPTITSAAGTSGNNQPVLFENHSMDGRYTGPLDVAPTVQASYGTGGNNQSLVAQPETYCIAGNAIDRQSQNGGNGLGCQPDICYTITATDHHAVYQDTVGALCVGDEKGTGNQYVNQDKCIVMPSNFIRRLTPLECERLQGFDDEWTDIPGASDSARYKALGNSVALPCVDYVLRGVLHFLREEERHA